ncbi:unnamed protein product [Peronospora farinosa]|uniref:Uncharacterized protein n=1 Tax=Peronospora farinosa TaxID=134698 RepID=A0ABN8CE39_9STRA|nr:unnamed protein product [Peronospora farinosa]
MLATRASFLSFLAPKSIPTLWTVRVITILWQLAVKRARKSRRRGHDTSDFMYGSESSTLRFQEEKKLDFDEPSIMKEAALLIVASGVISLADLEAVTGYRLSENRDIEVSPTKDNDASSEAATYMSDCSSIADSDMSKSTQEEGTTVTKLTATDDCTCQQPLAIRRTMHKPVKWVCIGYGRYVKKEDVAIRIECM